MKSKWKIALDILLTLVFLLLMDPRSVGGSASMEIHEWVGLGICVFFILHKILNWAWIKAMTLALFGKAGGKARLNYIVDLMLLIGMISIELSGMKIAKTIDFSWIPVGGEFLFWRFLHLSGSVLTLTAVGIHVGLHWKWVVKTTGSLFARKEPIHD